MDTRTGDIYMMDKERQKLLQKELGNRIKIMDIPPTLAQLQRKPINKKMGAIGRVGRNDPCPCGSGRKFKKCCYRRV